MRGANLATACFRGGKLTGADLTGAVGDLELAVRLAEQRGVRMHLA